MPGNEVAQESAETAGSSGRRWRFSTVLFDERTLELSVSGKLTEIERKPLEVLRFLLQHAGEIVTKDEILAAVWPGRILSDTVLSKAIARLRDALGEESSTAIKTVHGYGYRLVAMVSTEMSRAPAPAHFRFQPGDHPPQRPLWSLVKRLGAGTHGEAWLVRHDKTREQRVLKFALEERSLVSLKREITLFRLLRDSLGDRARVVTLRDWNLEHPPYFLEAEFAEGGSLVDWSAGRGGIGAIALPVRLEIVARIAEALSSIHAVGVLHKDLKPSNILISNVTDEIPDVLLGDLGSGGLLDPARLAAMGITRMGFTQTINISDAGSGTPLYLAPELLRGQPPTVQADIYALGVLLYQMTVGDLYRPLSAGWEREVEDELLRADIAAAAEGDPEHRLDNAAELARRLRSLELRRTQLERERKALEKAEAAKLAAERMRARRAALVLAFVAMAVGLVASTWLYVDARAARARAEQQTARAEAVADFLAKDLFSTVSSGSQPIKNMTVSQILDGAAEAIDKRFKQQPAVAAELHESIGRSYLQVVNMPQADVELSKALELYEKVEGPTGDSVVRILVDLVNTAYVAGTLPERVEKFERLLAEIEKTKAPHHQNKFVALVSLARSQQRLGRWTLAENSYRRAINAASTARHVDRNLVLSARSSLASVLIDLESFIEAEDLLRTLIADLVRVRGERHVDVAMARMRLGNLFRLVEKYDLAEMEITKSMTIVREWGTDSDARVLSAIYYLALLRFDQQRFAEGIEHLEAALALVEKSYVDESVDQTGEARRFLASAYRAVGRMAEAEHQFSSAVKSHERSDGINHVWTRISRVDLAEFLLERQRESEARAVLRTPSRITFDDLPPTHSFHVKNGRLNGRLDGLIEPSAIVRTTKAETLQQLLGGGLNDD